MSVVRPRPPDLDAHLPGIVAGDDGAFEAWLAGAELRLRDSLRSFAARVDVEGVLQETLLRVSQLAPRIEVDGHGNSLLRWAIRTARNLAVSELRRARVEPVEIDALEREAEAYDLDAVGPTPPRDPRLARLIWGCIERLPRQPGRALRERLEHGDAEPDERLAERVGMRRNTFLQNITRARKLIAECLKRHGVDLAAELA